MNLSPHFKLSEFTRSQIANENNLDNTPSDMQIENLKGLCTQVLEPLRNLVKGSIIITSGYRSEEVNRLAGGVNNSHHRCLGQFAAADCRAEGLTSRDFFKIIMQNVDSLPIEQVIEEHEIWVHISYRRPKRVCLLARTEEGRVVYTPANNSDFKVV